MLKIFKYNSHEITFDFGNGEIMVNATEMARTFKKLPKDFIRTQPTQDYIEALSKRTGILLGDLVKVIHGGEHNGTWLHRRLALRFAQWLHPDFAVWVDEKLEELLTTGHTSLEPQPERQVQPVQNLSLIELMEMSIQQHKAHDQRIATVETIATQTAQTVHRLAAKVSDVNDNYFTLSGYHVYRGRRYELLHNEECQKGKELTKASKLNGYRVGKAHSTKYGFVNTYHTDVLKAVLGF